MIIKKLLALYSFKYFLEVFLFTCGLLIALIATLLKNMTSINNKAQICKPLARSIALIFLMSMLIILNELYYICSLTGEPSLLYPMFSKDPLGLFVQLILCLFFSIFFYIVVDTILESQELHYEFILVLYFAMIGVIMLPVSDDLITGYLVLELIALSSYLLSSFYKTSTHSLGAGLIYFITGSVSSALFLYGCVLIYSANGTLSFYELYHIFSPLDVKYKVFYTYMMEFDKHILRAITILDPKAYLELQPQRLTFVDSSHLMAQLMEHKQQQLSSIVRYKQVESAQRNIQSVLAVQEILLSNQEIFRTLITEEVRASFKLNQLYAELKDLKSCSMLHSFLLETYPNHQYNSDIIKTMGKSIVETTKAIKQLERESYIRTRDVFGLLNDPFFGEKGLNRVECALAEMRNLINQHQHIPFLIDVVHQSNGVYTLYTYEIPEKLQHLVFFDKAESKSYLDYYLNYLLQDMITAIDHNPFVQDKLPLKLSPEFFSLTKMGILFILASLFIKLGAAPFHLWTLDVFKGSPTAATFFFAVMTKLSLFIFLTRFCYVAMPVFLDEWSFFALCIGFASLYVGAIGGLRQRNLKSILVYSSITHMGFALFSFSTGSFFGLQILILYLIVFIISNIPVWFSIFLLRSKKRKRRYYNLALTDLALLAVSNPPLAFSLSVNFFSIAGLPPFLGFIPKLGVFLTLLNEEFYFFCIAAVLFSVISTFYYIRIVKTMFFENALVGKLYYPINSHKVWLLSLFTFLVIFFFINPKLLFLIIHIILESGPK